MTDIDNYLPSIFDRTQWDVLFAKNVIEEAKRTGQWMLDSETNQPIHLKGCLNFSDLNRIENNIHYLHQKLIETTSTNLGLVVRLNHWTEQSIPIQNDFVRIMNNTERLAEVILHHSYLEDDLPINEDFVIDWQIMNAIEEMLHRMYEVFANLEKTSIFSGGITDEELNMHLRSGQEDILPMAKLSKKKE